MELTPANLMQMLRATLVAPRQAAAQVLRFGFAPSVGWMALMLMAVASALLTHISFALMPPEVQAVWGPAMASPVRTAILQWAVLLISVHAVHRLGRMRGGTGTLNEAVILLAWLQFVLLCVQVAQIVMQVIVPPLADILGVAGLVLFLWLLTNFVAELHGFRSLALVFVGILVAVVVLAVVLAIVLTLIFGAAAGV